MNGIKKSIESAIEFGKNTAGIFSGHFENIGQIENVVRNGGIIDKASNVIDMVIEKSIDSNKIEKNVGEALKRGKTSIINSIEQNLEKTISSQMNGIQKLEKYINNWEKYFDKKDFNGMEIEYNKIELELKKLVPIENVLKNVKIIENKHNFIKNNGKNFNITKDELELLEKFN